MAKSSSYARQFKHGTYPDQHWDESTRVNGHEVDSPSEVKKRQGVARGSQTEAYPGMAGKQAYRPKRGK
jgi:hypothetical protein